MKEKEDIHTYTSCKNKKRLDLDAFLYTIISFSRILIWRKKSIFRFF